MCWPPAPESSRSALKSALGRGSGRIWDQEDAGLGEVGPGRELRAVLGVEKL